MSVCAKRPARRSTKTRPARVLLIHAGTARCALQIVALKRVGVTPPRDVSAINQAWILTVGRKHALVLIRKYGPMDSAIMIVEN
jgi:hypothetical protein